MKAFLVLACTAVALSACHAETTAGSTSSSGGNVTVSSTVDINGKVTKSALAFSAFAMRTPSGGQTMTAAYVTVANIGSTADRLVSASCICASSAILHTTTHTNGMVGMAQTDGFALPAGQTLVFKPGGNHIMLMGVTGAPKEGDFEDVVLTFAKAGRVTLHMPVRDAPLSDDSTAGDNAMSGMKM